MTFIIQNGYSWKCPGLMGWKICCRSFLHTLGYALGHQAGVITETTILRIFSVELFRAESVVEAASWFFTGRYSTGNEFS